MTREQMIKLVQSAMDPSTDDDIVDAIIEELRLELPRSKISDMIFWPKVERTPTEIVDEALRIEAEPFIALTHQPSPPDEPQQ